jgi:hypothetical protein
MRIRDEDDWELVSDKRTGKSPRGYDIGCLTWRKAYHTPDGIRWKYKYQHYCDDTVEVNMLQRNIAQKGWKGDIHHVAAIPAGMAFNGYLAEAFAEHDDKAVAKWLNDPDNRAFRTKEGTI